VIFVFMFKVGLDCCGHCLLKLVTVLKICMRRERSTWL